MSGILSIVATPIGNLEDITYRAVRILRGADVVACEDTRITGKLLSHLTLKKSLVSLHEHSNAASLQALIGRLMQGQNVVYVSDAGTPGVNDPGGKLVALALAQGIKVEPIPGPSALAAAISVCGFAMDDFIYLGFVPHKKGRETFFRQAAERDIPSIFFESTHRMMKTAEALLRALTPDRQVFIGRELTKMHETLYRGRMADVMALLQSTSLKGEFVVIVGPK